MARLCSTSYGVAEEGKMTKKAKKVKKLFCVYYWNGSNCWQLFEPQIGDCWEERLKDLEVPILKAFVCRRVDKVICVSMPETVDPPKKLPKSIGYKPKRKDFSGIEIDLCKTAVNPM